MLSLLNVFNIPSHHVCRKIEKLNKNVENRKILQFLSFLGLLGQQKKSKNLNKIISHGTNFTSVEFHG